MDRRADPVKATGFFPGENREFDNQAEGLTPDLAPNIETDDQARTLGEPLLQEEANGIGGVPVIAEAPEPVPDLQPIFLQDPGHGNARAMNNMQKEMLRRCASAFFFFILCLVFFYPKAQYESCIYNLRFWNLAWPTGGLVFIVYFIWLLWKDLRGHVDLKLGLLYLIMVANTVAEFGFIAVWIWEYLVKKNLACFNYTVALVEVIFVGSFAMTFFCAIVGLAAIFISSWRKSLKLRKQGAKLLGGIYDKVEKSKVTEEELRQFTAASQNKEILDKHEILPRELKHLRKFYCVKLKRDQEPDCEKECCICLGPYAKNDELMVTPRCKHVFHFGCTEVWLKKYRTCPICKENVRIGLLLTLGLKDKNKLFSERDAELGSLL